MRRRDQGRGGPRDQTSWRFLVAPLGPNNLGDLRTSRFPKGTTRRKTEEPGASRIARRAERLEQAWLRVEEERQALLAQRGKGQPPVPSKDPSLKPQIHPGHFRVQVIQPF